MLASTRGKETRTDMQSNQYGPQARTTLDRSDSARDPTSSKKQQAEERKKRRWSRREW
ncbi:hypothetical protein FIBSPDRAFT_853736 [Athelia psychrophila]|uniref:Uncharacterized protein n=1 Tax=Athelia psychrophila TaxID=1759441 RepID=A0A166QGJ0_9AGAM|nr:hypothetical protein FIBSPDRAFT_853736 [Fibularhizoctonia sp. CBS 109695]